MLIFSPTSQIINTGKTGDQIITVIVAGSDVDCFFNTVAVAPKQAGREQRKCKAGRQVKLRHQAGREQKKCFVAFYRGPRAKY